jgi:hypothetical protein
VSSDAFPQQTIQAWGDHQHTLTDQQITDVITYIISLNGGMSAVTATPAASGS